MPGGTHSIAREVLEGFAALSTATVHEAADKRGALPAAIRPLAPGMRLCGPALTVSCLPGDNLMLHAAVAAASPGDILVATVGGEWDRGYWGEILAVGGRARGVAGLVLDGCVRDAGPLRALGFPVFCRGLSIRGTTKVGAGSIRRPLAVGEVTVHPGDLVLGDEDGVVVVPAAEAPAILEKARAREAWEKRLKADLAAGRLTIDLLGLREILRQKGVDPGPPT